MVYVPDYLSDPYMFERRNEANGYKKLSRDDLIKELTKFGISNKRISKAMELATREPMRIFHPDPTGDKSVSIKIENNTWWMKVHSDEGKHE